MKTAWQNRLPLVCGMGEITWNAPMCEHTSMRVGGPADALVAAKREEDIRAVMSFAREEDVPLLVLGMGSNLIVRSGGIRGIVLQITGKAIQIRGMQVYVEAGAKLPMLSREAMQKNLAGLEFAQGIPGSVGGAVIMNAGAYGGQMADVLRRVRYIDQSLTVHERDICDGDLGYRSSVFSREGWTVLSADLTLARDMDGSARKRFDAYRKLRQEKQPLEYPSAGSVFKRPEGYFAGALIQEAGLKGLRIGGASVSEKHAGFIVNDQNAVAEDVIALIAEVQRRVLDNSGVLLEREVRILGEPQ